MTLVPASSHGGTVDAAAVEALFTANGQIFQGTGVGTGVLTLNTGYQFDYVEVTASLVITATTIGTAQTFLQGNAVTYDGATRICIEVYWPWTDIVGNAQVIYTDLFDGATRLGEGSVQKSSTIEEFLGPCHYRRYLTPTAGSHTYALKSYCTANNGSGLSAGLGGADYLPAYIRITKA